MERFYDQSVFYPSVSDDVAEYVVVNANKKGCSCAGLCVAAIAVGLLSAAYVVYAVKMASDKRKKEPSYFPSFHEDQ
jgi:hypothetical protein